VQRGFRGRSHGGIERSAIERDCHHVAGFEHALIAPGHRDRDSVVVDPHREVATGSRRPPARRELDAGMCDFHATGMQACGELSSYV
jgi:hypothetical protein